MWSRLSSQMACDNTHGHIWEYRHVMETVKLQLHSCENVCVGVNLHWTALGLHTASSYDMSELLYCNPIKFDYQCAQIMSCRGLLYQTIYESLKTCRQGSWAYFYTICWGELLKPYQWLGLFEQITLFHMRTATVVTLLVGLHHLTSLKGHITTHYNKSMIGIFPWSRYVVHHIFHWMVLKSAHLNIL